MEEVVLRPQGQAERGRAAAPELPDDLDGARGLTIAIMISGIAWSVLGLVFFLL